jgi:uncharacterized membrane-anchored protein YhcB (DUF1043 family)
MTQTQRKGQAMSEQKLDLESDLREAREMAEGLEEYLRGSEVYGSLGGGLFGSGSKPALTIGALLLRLRRLNALRDQLTPAQQSALDGVQHQHDTVRKEWTRHYAEKLVREANSRLDAMRTYFEECRENPRLCASAYLPEAMRRTIVQEIAAFMNANGMPSEELRTKIAGADGKLRSVAKPTDFVWAAALMPVYPKSDFWWLYARPPQP